MAVITAGSGACRSGGDAAASESRAGPVQAGGRRCLPAGTLRPDVHGAAQRVDPETALVGWSAPEAAAPEDPDVEIFNRERSHADIPSASSGDSHAELGSHFRQASASNHFSCLFSLRPAPALVGFGLKSWRPPAPAALSNPRLQSALPLQRRRGGNVGDQGIVGPYFLRLVVLEIRTGSRECGASNVLLCFAHCWRAVGTAAARACCCSFRTGVQINACSHR
jgi:hypothetical protein